MRQANLIWTCLIILLLSVLSSAVYEDYFHHDKWIHTFIGVPILIQPSLSTPGNILVLTSISVLAELLPDGSIAWRRILGSAEVPIDLIQSGSDMFTLSVQQDSPPDAHLAHLVLRKFHQDGSLLWSRLVPCQFNNPLPPQSSSSPLIRQDILIFAKRERIALGIAVSGSPDPIVHIQFPPRRSNPSENHPSSTVILIDSLRNAVLPIPDNWALGAVGSAPLQPSPTTGLIPCHILSDSSGVNTSSHSALSSTRGVHTNHTTMGALVLTQPDLGITSYDTTIHATYTPPASLSSSQPSSPPSPTQLPIDFKLGNTLQFPLVDCWVIQQPMLLPTSDAPMDSITLYLLDKFALLHAHTFEPLPPSSSPPDHHHHVLHSQIAWVRREYIPYALTAIHLTTVKNEVMTPVCPAGVPPMVPTRHNQDQQLDPAVIPTLQANQLFTAGHIRNHGNTTIPFHGTIPKPPLGAMSVTFVDDIYERVMQFLDSSRSPPHQYNRFAVHPLAIVSPVLQANVFDASVPVPPQASNSKYPGLLLSIFDSRNLGPLMTAAISPQVGTDDPDHSNTSLQETAHLIPSQALFRPTIALFNKSLICAHLPRHLQYARHLYCTTMAPPQADSAAPPVDDAIDLDSLPVCGAISANTLHASGDGDGGNGDANIACIPPVSLLDSQASDAVQSGTDSDIRLYLTNLTTNLESHVKVPLDKGGSCGSGALAPSALPCTPFESHVFGLGTVRIGKEYYQDTVLLLICTGSQTTAADIESEATHFSTYILTSTSIMDMDKNGEQSRPVVRFPRRLHVSIPPAQADALNHADADALNPAFSITVLQDGTVTPHYSDVQQHHNAQLRLARPSSLTTVTATPVSSIVPKKPRIPKLSRPVYLSISLLAPFMLQNSNISSTFQDLLSRYYSQSEVDGLASNPATRRLAVRLSSTFQQIMSNKGLTSPSGVLDIDSSSMTQAAPVAIPDLLHLLLSLPGQLPAVKVTSCESFYAYVDFTEHNGHYIINIIDSADGDATPVLRIPLSVITPSRPSQQVEGAIKIHFIDTYLIIHLITTHHHTELITIELYRMTNSKIIIPIYRATSLTGLMTDSALTSTLYSISPDTLVGAMSEGTVVSFPKKIIGPLPRLFSVTSTPLGDVAQYNSTRVDSYTDLLSRNVARIATLLHVMQDATPQAYSALASHFTSHPNAPANLRIPLSKHYLLSSRASINTTAVAEEGDDAADEESDSDLPQDVASHSISQGVVSHYGQLQSPVPPVHLVSMNHTVLLSRIVVTSPTHYESTSTTTVLGLDLYSVNVSPSGTFDILPASFNKPLLTITIITVILLAFYLRYKAQHTSHHNRWK